MQEDDWNRSQGAYVANCLGMVVRWMYNSKEFKLFTDIISKTSVEDESLEAVKAKILAKLGVSGKETVANGSI